MRNSVRRRTFVTALALPAALIFAAGVSASSGTADDEATRDVVRIVVQDENGRHEDVFRFDEDHPRPFLGVVIGTATEDGVRVGRVLADTGAERAGLAAGDVITRIGGEPVTDARDVTRAVLKAAPGDWIDLDVLRDGTPMSLSAELTEHEGEIVELGLVRDGRELTVDVCLRRTGPAAPPSA